MHLDHLRWLGGPNLYVSRPVAIACLELEELTGRETTDFAGFAERLAPLLPGLSQHHCSAGRPGGFLDAMARGTYFGHVTEHVTLELSSMVGREVFFGRTVWAGAPGRYDVILECPRDEPAGASVVENLIRLGIQTVTEVLAGRTPVLTADLAAIASAYAADPAGRQHRGARRGGAAARHPRTPDGPPQPPAARVRLSPADGLGRDDRPHLGGRDGDRGGQDADQVPAGGGRPPGAQRVRRGVRRRGHRGVPGHRRARGGQAADRPPRREGVDRAVRPRRGGRRLPRGRHGVRGRPRRGVRARPRPPRARRRRQGRGRRRAEPRAGDRRRRTPRSPSSSPRPTPTRYAARATTAR